MSEYYNPKKTKGLFNPDPQTVFVVSRTGIDLFTECPRCFYLDKRLGVARPPGFPFSLNNAVDLLLKKEFDAHRAVGRSHPLMATYGIEAVPYTHEQLEEWRDSRTRGIRYLHTPTNLMVRGGIDDIWVNSKTQELHIVDYKATSKTGEVNLDAAWQDGYKRQVEVYQWLFRRNGFKVSDTAYFVYCNGATDREAFDAKLEFDIKIIPYSGQDNWVEDTLFRLRACLENPQMPPPAANCDYCNYMQARQDAES